MSKTPTDNTLQAIISHAKEYGFVFPSSEIYDGLGAVYDYGPYGSQLKKNIRNALFRISSLSFHPVAPNTKAKLSMTVRSESN
jgi:hypothetical protein